MTTVFLFDRIYDNPLTGEWMLVSPWGQIPQGFEKTKQFIHVGHRYLAVTKLRATV